MVLKAKTKAISTAAAPVAAPIFKTALHSHFAEQVAVLDVAQRHVLLAPAGSFEDEKSALLHRALLDRRNAYCARCLSAGSPAVHPCGLDPDAATDDSPFHSLDRGRGVSDHCPFGHYTG